MRRAVARGRVFPQSFSTDRRYGRLSLKACALFPLMWANADDQGRLCGDPEEVKYSVCPNIDHITKADMPGLLKELEQNGLIHVYDTPKSPAIQLLDWWDVNHKMQWAWPSDYRPPDGWQDRLRYKKGAATVITQNWSVPSGEGQSSAQVSGDRSASGGGQSDAQVSGDKPPSAESQFCTQVNGDSPTPEESSDVQVSADKSTSGETHSDAQVRSESLTPEEDSGAHLTPGGGSGEAQKDIQVGSAPHSGNSEAHLTTERASGESSGEFSGEPQKGVQVDLDNSSSSFPRTPYHHPQSEKEEETRRGRGKRNSPERSPEPSGEKRPSPTAAVCPDITILDRLSSCFRKEWGRVLAERPYEVIPRQPDARESAQLRDLAKELSGAGGCPLDFIDQAFRDAAGRPDKMHISYVRAILIDWLGRERVRVRSP